MEVKTYMEQAGCSVPRNPDSGAKENGFSMFACLISRSEVSSRSRKQRLHGKFHLSLAFAPPSRTIVRVRLVAQSLALSRQPLRAINSEVGHFFSLFLARAGGGKSSVRELAGQCVGGSGIRSKCNYL